MAVGAHQPGELTGGPKGGPSPSTGELVPHRRVALWLVFLGTGIFVVAAGLLVPWQPVPGGMPEPASTDGLFTGDQLAAAEDYATRARILSWTSLGVSLLVSCWLGFSRLGTRLLGTRRWPWPVTVVGLVAVVTLIGRLVTLPFSLLLREQRVDAGLTEQPISGYLLDQAKGLGIGIAFTSLALVGLVACARRWRTWWPAIVAGLGAALVVVSSFLYPLVVEPVFNSFESMPDGLTRTRILALAETEGVDVEDVLVADASRRTTMLNAYVSGFGETRRVVVYDNLVNDLPLQQVLSVVAHELAHARHRDVVIGTSLGAVGVGLGVGLLGLALAHPGVRRRSGVAGAHDPRSVALLLALVAVASFAASPVENSISRHLEIRADVDALDATDNGEAFIQMQRQLCLRSRCDPSPPALSHFWFGSHPTTLERVAVADQITGD